MRTLAVAFAAILMTTGLANAAATPSVPLQNTFVTEAQAKAHCPRGRVVWMNKYNLIYHHAGSRNYGKTLTGAYMCERDAVAAAGRAAPNEKY